MRMNVGRHRRPASSFILSILVAATVALAPQPASADARLAAIPAALKSEGSSRGIEDFYRARNYKPLWIQGGRLGPEARQFLQLVETAWLDGLRPSRFRARKLRSILGKAESGSPEALARAEMLLSESFAAYVAASRKPDRDAVTYGEHRPPSAQAALEAAAAAPSLRQYLASLGWMHPIYGELRKALANPALTARQEALLRLNLERVRAIPPHPHGRHVLIDAAGARLWMYEDGEVRGTMRVVVGRAQHQTPMIGGLLRYAVLNPYWNVPPDLAAELIAPKVLDEGLGYLKAHRYEILSDWSDRANTLDPAGIDWRAVAAGQLQLRMRQLPGGANSMGDVKFVFPNDLGIYLHDTPDKHLMREAQRQFSAGCIRLEDAPRLGRWLFGKRLNAKSKAPEQAVSLPVPIPVYITYLTAAPEEGRIQFRPDVYQRDRTELADFDIEVRGTH